MTKKKNTFAFNIKYLLQALVMAISLVYFYSNAKAEEDNNTKELELKSKL